MWSGKLHYLVDFWASFLQLWIISDSLTSFTQIWQTHTRSNGSKQTWAAKTSDHLSLYSSSHLNLFTVPSFLQGGARKMLETIFACYKCENKKLALLSFLPIFAHLKSRNMEIRSKISTFTPQFWQFTLKFWLLN